MSTENTAAPVKPFDPDAEFFADPKKLTRLPVPALGPKGWVEVREEISIGEERRVFANAVKGQVTTKDGEQRLDYDMERVSFGTTALHIVDWSIKKPAYSPDALKALKPAYYKAIDAVVQAFIKERTEGNAKALPSSSASQTSESAA